MTEIPSREGQLLAGKYQLAERLGVGGMGEVYRARNVLIGRVVAIKLLLPEHAKNQEVSQRFLREAQAANLVRHPNVVDVIDIDHDEQGTPYIVQEFLEGVDLDRELERGALPVSVVLETLLPVVDAVGFAHQKGVIHRDLKPANVFLAREHGKVVPKLLDFGISHVTTSESRMTQVGRLMGTPRYMSPEQVRAADDVDARSDVWALGVILYQALSGQMPFPGPLNSGLFVSICTDEPPPLLHVAPNLPSRLAEIVHRCLRKRREERFSNAVTLAAELRRLDSGANRSIDVMVSLEDPVLPMPAFSEGDTFAPDLPVRSSKSKLVEAREAAGQPRVSAPLAQSSGPSRPSRPSSSQPALGDGGGKAREALSSRVESGEIGLDEDMPAMKIELATGPSYVGDAAATRAGSNPPRSRSFASGLSSRRPERLAAPVHEDDDVDSWTVRRVIVLLVLVSVAVAALAGLLHQFPTGWPVFVWAVPAFRSLPVPLAVGIGTGFGLTAILLLAGATRITPFPWGVILVCIGCILLAFFGAGTALGVVDEPFGEVPVLVPIAASLVPLGFGLFGLQRLGGRASNEAWLPFLVLTVGGLFVAYQLARVADAQPASGPDTPATVNPAADTPVTTTPESPIPAPPPQVMKAAGKSR